jgi:GDP-mannose 6-dehydrogenase
MKISIFGMGYVGCVTAACLLKQGHYVVGIDVVDHKIEMLRQGTWPIFENGLEELVSKETLAKNFRAVSDGAEPFLNTDLSMICVGTPGLPDGKVDLTYVTRTAELMARALTRKQGRHIVLIRSTVPPGSTESVFLPILRKGMPGDNLAAGFYPEFLREGAAIEDFFNPSLNVLGCAEGFPVEILNDLLPEVTREVQVTSIRVAESIKYANNTFHALKIAFANELASICNTYGVNTEDVMDIFCRDTTLNISPYYLRPGFAFGGSCLPKEIRAVIAMAKEKRIESTLFEGILKSNDQMVERFVSFVYSMNPSSVGYFGITFKPETDDIRESPVLRAIEMFLSKTTSYSKRIRQVVFDGMHVISKVRGRFGDDFEIADTPDELIRASDVIVLGPYRINRAVESEIIASGKPVIDLKWHRVGEDLLGYAGYHSLH